MVDERDGAIRDLIKDAILRAEATKNKPRRYQRRVIYRTPMWIKVTVPVLYVLVLLLVVVEALRISNSL